jgi:hypothetical protein
MDQDRRFLTTCGESRTAARLSAGVAALETAWRHSAARKAMTVGAASLGDRRRGAATMAVAATVALVVPQLRATTEPALWMLPAFVLIWAAGNLLWPSRKRG